MNRDWIVIDMSTGQFRCLRCGDVVGVGLPVSVDELCRRSFAFTSYHMDCEPESAELAPASSRAATRRSQVSMPDHSARVGEVSSLSVEGRP